MDLLRTRRYRLRAGVALVLLALMAGAVGAPGVAQAHDWEAPGINDAQLNLSPDGYDGNGGVNTFLGVVPANVEGRKFVANDIAHVYLCKAGEVDLANGCQPLGAAPTMADGTFSVSLPGWTPTITRPDGSQITCVGAAGGGRVQCAVVAATFVGLDSAQVTAKAEHYVCFSRPESQNGCIPGPQGPKNPPPNSTHGERLSLSKDREFSVYAEVTQVSGTKFAPSATAEIFKCPALAGNLHAECRRIGVAPTDATGGFGPVPVPFDNLSPSCAAAAQLQCSVVAATFNSPTDTESTSRAEHFVCVTGTFYPCTPGDPTRPTSTTIAPEWQPAASMSAARQRHASTTGTDGRIYSMGGHEADGTVLSSAEVFDPCGAKTWKALPPMPTPRTQFAAAAGPDGRIYAIGGSDELSGTPLASVDAYDPTTNSWSRVASLAVPRARLAATTGSDGRIYAIGGVIGVGRSGGEAVPTVEAYDPATNVWELVTPLNVARADLGAATAADGHIFVIGGRGYDNAFLAPPVESYAPGSGGTPGLWQVRAVKRLVPTDPAVTAGADGLLYIIGGQGFAGDIRRAVMSYDPVTDGWADLTEPMATHRTTAAATSGKDGRVYAIGGTEDLGAVEGPPPLSSVESLKVAPNMCPALPPVADFNGDRSTDVAVFRPANGVSYLRGQTPEAVAWGAEGDVPVPGDYDGDRQSDLAVFRPSNGVWYLKGQTPDALAWGVDGDVPVPADYDGDHKTDVAVFRPSNGTWYIRQSSTGAELAANYGAPGDVPVPHDYDGDRKADIAVFRPSKGVWYMQGQSPDANAYGAPGDIPVPADYDGDGDADIAVLRPSNGVWYLRNQTPDAVAHGADGDIPVPSDYDGDGIADLTVFRPSNGIWYLENGEAIAWGATGDVPLPLPAAVRAAYFGGTP
ncbi:MAG TPA: kelch repeat-containing protein [Acidimicrobiales bacterium]|nr:kelch repeat-containing protein [Acidimicrobiales bacterium]